MKVNKNAGKKILKICFPQKFISILACYTSKQAIELLCRANAWWLVKAKWSPDTCYPELGGQFYLGKCMSKMEHDGIGTCTRIKISQIP